VVRPLIRISALNRKLLRDLWLMKGQATAIALVIGTGIAMYVSYQSNFHSLSTIRARYYAERRFADVFAHVNRAPHRIVDRVLAVSGVEDAEPRVVADVVLDVPGLEEPASGRLVSIPSEGRPRLNDLYLREGSWISRERPDDIIANEAFMQAHGFVIGAELVAIINGRRRPLRIVGIALSPEYVFSIRPGELVPDAKRYGVFWMGAEALSGAFDMDGAFNDLVIKLARDAVPEAAVASVDRLLEPYGGQGAILRKAQFSNWTLESELTQLQTMGFFVPAIFLLVAAFVLNIALTRALALQRPQLAALKALGYTNMELARHYLGWAVVIAAGGAVVGIAGGIWMGSSMLSLYTEYFKFPELTYQLTGGMVAEALAIAVGAAIAGALTAVRRAVRIAPAEAMRPEPPARFRASVIERPWLKHRLTTASRMVLRNLERQPARAATTVVGIACAGAILQVGFTFIDAMSQLIDTQFSVAERQNMTVSFVEPVSADARHALARLPGVVEVESRRSVPVRLGAGHRVRTLAIIGLPSLPHLMRPIDRDQRVIRPPAEGLIVSAILAKALAVRPGDTVEVELLEGARLERRLPIAGLVDDIFGIWAYMEIDALHRLMREDRTLTGAALVIDTAREADLSARLKVVPAVAGVAAKRVVIQNFRDTMAKNMGLMLTFNVLFAAVIAFGVVYNAARVSLSERSRELASLRVLGFTRAEISLILLGELGILTVLSLPMGAVIGYVLTSWLIGAVESEIYRFPFALSTQVMAWAALTVVAASLISGLVVRRQLDRLDLVGVLKSRE
jgi:putative ABC transport system permease protein